MILKPVSGSRIFHLNLSLSKLAKQKIEKLHAWYVDAINVFIEFAKVEDLGNSDIRIDNGQLWSIEFKRRRNVLTHKRKVKKQDAN